MKSKIGQLLGSYLPIIDTGKTHIIPIQHQCHNNYNINNQRDKKYKTPTTSSSLSSSESGTETETETETEKVNDRQI